MESFLGIVEIMDFGRMSYAVVHLPEEIERRVPYPKGSKARVRVEVGDLTLNLALMPRPGRTHYLLLSQANLRKIGVEVGEPVAVTFTLVGEEVELPPDVSEALEADHAAAVVWDRLTPGRQRASLVPVLSAVRPETRAARLAEMLEALRARARVGAGRRRIEP